MSVSTTEQQEAVERFLAAVRSGDMQGLLDVLAPDVLVVADGGGLVVAARRPIEGAERAAAFLATASRSAGGLSRVYTTGGGARIPGLNDVLGARLKVPIELANPVQRLRVKDDVFETVPVDEVAPLLMLAVGLALRRAS